MSANAKAQAYWTHRCDDVEYHSRRPSARAESFMHDASMWQSAFRALADGEVCCPSDAIQFAIDEMNARFDGENVIAFGGQRHGSKD